MDRFLGEVRPTTCVLAPCPSQLTNAARERLAEWVMGVVNASSRTGVVSPVFKEAVIRPVGGGLPEPYCVGIVLASLQSLILG